MGFIGCNLNPDPSGGYWGAPPLTDKYWYPFYEKMVELDVPAMVHVSATCNPAFHTTGSHYINADTTAFMQFLDRRPVQGFSGAAIHHPARRRRGPLSLGPLPRPRAGHEAADAAGSDAQQHLLRHLRVPHAGDRAAAEDRPDRQHPVRIRNGRRRARHRSGHRPLLRRHQTLCRSGHLAERRRQAQAVRGQRAQGLPPVSTGVSSETDDRPPHPPRRP